MISLPSSVLPHCFPIHPDHVLLTPTRLNSEEIELMRTLTTRGRPMVDAAPVRNRAQVEAILRSFPEALNEI